MPVAAVVALVIVGFWDEELKLLGPDHEYVAPDTVVAYKFNVEPAQIDPPVLAVGAEGIALTVAAVVAAEEVQPLTVAVTLYVPVIAVVALGRVGFWAVDVKLLGPVHEYVAPDTVEAYKLRVPPEQTVPPLLAVGAEGIALTVTNGWLYDQTPHEPLYVTQRK